MSNVNNMLICIRGNKNITMQVILVKIEIHIASAKNKY